MDLEKAIVIVENLDLNEVDCESRYYDVENDALKSILSHLKLGGVSLLNKKKKVYGGNVAIVTMVFIGGDNPEDITIMKYCPTCGFKITEIVRLKDEEVI